MPAELYPHKSGLGLVEPVVLIQQNVAILWNNTWEYHFVTYLEPIPPFQFLDLGPIVAQTVSAKAAATNLEVMSRNGFAQIRWYPIDNAQIRVYVPEADGRFRLNNLRSIVDMNILDRDPCLHLTEIFIWELNEPWFEAINLMDYALTQCRLIGMGYRYEVKTLEADAIKAIKDGRLPCTYLVCQGLGIGQRP